MAAAQYQMGVGVATGFDDCRVALAVDTEVTMAMGGGTHGVAGDGNATVGAVLEAYWQIKTAGHFAVDLRFRRAGANGHPAQQVVEVAGGDGLQQLGGDRQAHAQHFKHQFPRQGQAVGHVIAAIQVRVVG